MSISVCDALSPALEGIYEPAAVAIHMGKSTLGEHSERVMFLTARNQVLLLAKHYPAATLRRFRLAHFSGTDIVGFGSRQTRAIPDSSSREVARTAAVVYVPESFNGGSQGRRLRKTVG